MADCGSSSDARRKDRAASSWLETEDQREALIEEALGLRILRGNGVMMLAQARYQDGDV